MDIKNLIGSGDKIMIFTLSFVALGMILNVFYPLTFYIGAPAPVLEAISFVLLITGIIIWLWAVVLILINVPQRKLITHGPYHLVKHPIYTSVALLVLPWAGFLLNTWLGVPLGIILYIASRIFSGEEEKKLSAIFGRDWDVYWSSVLIRWL
ncbi:MAG TPA: isoprenylcysteine carboxylmethyltransferase family protein [Ignavibacteriaceae bacterium]